MPGTFDLKTDHSRGKLSLWLIPLIAVLLTIGWFIVGILLIRIMPVRFLQVESEVRTNTIVRCVAGFAGIIIAFVAFVLLAITIVLLPLALILGVMVLVGLLLANLFVASSLGRIIFGYLKWSGTEWQLFTVGFVVLCHPLHYSRSSISSRLSSASALDLEQFSMQSGTTGEQSQDLPLPDFDGVL